MREREIFEAAFELQDEQARAAYLAQACGPDDALRREIEALIDMESELGDFLNSPVSVTVDALVEPDCLDTEIGPYRIREQIGEGGFGIVYVAEQSAPVRRKVALKIIKPGMDSRNVIARFEAERQALAQMQHPNIAQVFDAGTTASGRPYFVMELVKGVSMTSFCDERHLSPRERLELFCDVCRAVHHAHQKGVIHRDLKPSNVLITLHDDRPVVKIIDFGISKALNSSLDEFSVYTAYDQLIGTPLYMSPEQAQLSGIDVDTRSDVYSLGVLLYELLTGTTPFDKQTLQNAGLDELRRIIREDAPPRPSARVSTLNARGLTTISANRNIDPAKLSQAYRREIDWIVMQALEKDRTRRYESARDFAVDVERFLNQEPIAARPPSKWYRFCKLVQRRRTAAFSIAVLAVAAFVGIFGITWGLFRARDAEQRMQVERDTANSRAALNAFIRDLTQPQPQTVGWRNELVDRAKRDRLLRQNPGHVNIFPELLRGLDASVEQTFREEASSIAFDSAGAGLALGGTSRRAARYRDVRNKAWSRTRCRSAGPVAFVDGRPLQLAAGPDATFTLWDLTADKQVASFAFRNPAGNTRPLVPIRYDPEIVVSAMTPDGKTIAAAATVAGDGRPSKNSWIAVWNRNGEQIRGFAFEATALALSPDGALLAAGNSAGRVNVWQIADGRLRAAFSATRNRLHCLAFRRDRLREPSPASSSTRPGWLLAAGDAGGTIAICDIQKGAVRTHCRGSMHEVFSVAFDPTGMLLASCGRSYAAVWDAATGRMLLKLPHSQYMTCAVWSGDGQRLAVSGLLRNSTDKGVVIWKLENGRGLRTMRGLVDAGAKVAFSPGGRYLAALSHSWHVAIWDLTANRLLHILRVPPGKHVDNAALAFSRDNEHLVFAAGETATLWNVRTGRCEKTQELPDGLQDRILFHPAAGEILSIRYEADDKSRLPWNKDRKRVCRLRRLFGSQRTAAVEIRDFPKRIFFIAAAPDADRFVIDGLTANGMRSANAYDSLSGTRRWSQPISEEVAATTYQLPIDPGSNFVGLPRKRNSATLVELQTKNARVLPFLPNCLGGGGGKYSAMITSGPEKIRVYQGSDGTPILHLASFQVPSDYESQFSPDGRLLAWANHDGSVSVADIREIRAQLKSLDTD